MTSVEKFVNPQLTRRGFVGASAGAAMVLALTGCSSSESSTTTSTATSYEDTIVFSMTSTPTGSFMLNLGVNDYDGGISWMCHAPMLIPNDKGELQPYLAESYEMNDEGTVYKFKLRENALWNDGEKVTANDVAFTIMQLADPTNDGVFDDEILYIKGGKEYREGTATEVEGINVIDDYNIEVTLTQYYCKGLSFLGQIQIYPEHIWKGIAFEDIENHTDLMENPVGCGPYKVTEFKQGEYVKLEAFDDFFLGTPKTKNIVVKVTNSDSLAAELANGDVDIADVTNFTNDEIDALTSEGYGISTCYYDLFQTLSFNYDKMEYPKELRKAIQYAIDRQGLVDSLLEGRGIVSNMLMTPASWAYPEDVEGVSQDVEKAKEYLEQAGYKDVNGDGYVEDPDGNEFSLEILYPTGLKVREQSAVVFQDNLAQIGIKVELTTAPDFSTLFSIKAENHHDIFLMGYGVDNVDPDPTNFVKEAYGFNQEMVNKCVEASETPDQDTRKAIYKEIAEYISEEAPILCLYSQIRQYAHPADIEAYEPNTFDQYVNIDKWAIPQTA